MKILVPKTLYGAFSPTMIVNLALGLGVFQYPFGKMRRTVSAIWSLINLSINLSLVLTANVTELEPFKESTILIKIYQNYMYLFTVFIAVSMLLIQVTAKVAWRNFEKLNNINERLERLGVTADYDVILKIQIIRFTVGFAYIFSILIFDFMSIPASMTVENFSYIRNFLAMHHWMIFAFAFDSSYINTFRYFCNRFQRLNSLLVEPTLHKVFDASFSQNKSSDRDLQYSLTLTMKEIHGNLPLNRSTGWQEMLHIVSETRKIHRDLCNAAMNFSKAFCVQILLSIMLSAYLLTSLLYNSYLLSMGIIKLPGYNVMILMISPVLWVTFYVLKLFLIAHTGETIKYEAERTGQLIHTLLNSTIIYDKDVRDELKIFSLQLMQNPFRISIGGFFVIDHELFYEIIGKISTYLIVLIQMRHFYES